MKHAEVVADAFVSSLPSARALASHAFQRKSDSIARQVVTQEQWLRFRYIFLEIEWYFFLRVNDDKNTISKIVVHFEILKYVIIDWETPCAL